MKRLMTAIMLAVLAVTNLGGCYGKFALTRKIHQVNGQVGERHLRSALTWVFIIVPVYQVAALADFIAFNTIEFWTGSNPLTAGAKDLQYREGERRFDIHAEKVGDTLSYRINQYEGDRYIDSLNIRWQLSTGHATAQHRQAERTIGYVATRVGDGVQVQTYVKGVTDRTPEYVAFYR